MREIKYTVSLDGVSPSNVQFGGMQGEHNATRLNVEISGDLLSKLEGAGYRFEVEDGAGCRQTIAMGESVSESIICKIPQSVTCNGGNVTIRLIFSKVDETEIEYILYSFPMKLRFDLTSNGEFTENKDASDISAAVSLAKGYTEKAEQAANTAENAAELAVNAREGIEQEIANSLMEAKNSGEFDGKDGKDGKDGTPATHKWNGTVLTVTSASGTSSSDLKGEKGDKGDTGSTGPRGEKGEKGDDGKDGKDGADYVLTDDDKSEIATRVNAVSYFEEQSLSDEEKQTARENIGAVDASLVVDNLVSNKQFLTDHIPKGQAVQSFIEANAVSSAVAQTLSDSKKQIARTNIGAISQVELDEAIANIGGSGTSEVWETIADITLEEAVGIIKVNQDTDGQEFSLKRAKIIVDTDNTTNFYTATGTLMMGLMSADNGVSARSMFLYNFIPDTAGKYSRAFFEIELVDGMAFISGCCKNNLAALNNSEFASSFTKYSNLPFAAMNGIINNISVSTNYKNGFAIGTHIKILGVRA